MNSNIFLCLFFFILCSFSCCLCTATDSVIPPFNGEAYTTALSAFEAYGEWHNATLKSTNSCKKANIVVWSAQAGFGDSVNALTSAFRYALAHGRLFFIMWSSVNNPSLWNEGLLSPGFAWDWHDALRVDGARCGFSMQQLQRPEATRKSAAAAKPAPRHVAIKGSIVADNPLASIDYQQHRTVWSMNEQFLQKHLLRPNPLVQSLIDSYLPQFRSAHAVIGLQIRTGHVDDPNYHTRYNGARFLAPGDEWKFVGEAKRIISAKYSSHSSDVKIFLMTDSPEVRKEISKHFNVKEKLKVITVKNGPISHCGPYQNVKPKAFIRMLSEWYLFHHVTDAITTAWSLFGSTASEGIQNVIQIDHSKCGQPNEKQCMADFK